MIDQGQNETQNNSDQGQQSMFSFSFGQQNQQNVAQANQLQDADEIIVGETDNQDQDKEALTEKE